MRLHNLIQMKHLPNLHLHRPRLNLLDQIVQWGVMEFFRTTVVCCPVLVEECQSVVSCPPTIQIFLLRSCRSVQHPRKGNIMQNLE